jgi:hypothetical protein
MQPKIELLKARDFGEIINDTFTFIRQNLKPLLRYFFIFCGFFMIVGTITTVMQQTKMAEMVDIVRNTNAGETYGRSPFYMFTPDYWINILAIGLTYFSLMVMVLSYMAVYKEKGNNIPTTEELWGFIKYYFIKITLSSILITILIVAGFVFCLLPGFYLATVLSLVAPIMVMENATFGYAFSRSFDLIKNNFWITFGTLAVIGIINYFARLILALPAAIFFAGNLFLHTYKNTNFSIIAVVVSAILTQLGLFFSIIPVIGCAFCYFNLTETRDGTGLLGRINQFGAAGADTHTPEEEY